ncbi:guanine nucleotide exchange factor [Aspergillus pseudonomiae]|nr:guanine nucleotide exchange factor [Aspergillus pseudonomiae]
MPGYTWDSSSTLISEVHLNRLVDILDNATRVYSDEDLDRYGSPLVQALLLISQGISAKLKAHLQALVLPTNKDHERVIGTGDFVSARLLRCSTSVSAGQLRLLIPSLLFELCGNDETQFVRNIGYGYASGFLPLLKNQLALSTPGDSKDHTSDSTGRTKETEPVAGEETGQNIQGDSSAIPAIEHMAEGEINPVTGQRRDMETPQNTPEMTMEEKEREAERLFVLFQRLQETGVIQVENPLVQAMREGRLE